MYYYNVNIFNLQYRCNTWAKLCHRFDLVDADYGACNRTQRLCSAHFEPDCYDIISGKLRNGAVPSIFAWTIQKTIATSGNYLIY